MSKLPSDPVMDNLNSKIQEGLPLTEEELKLLADKNSLPKLAVLLSKLSGGQFMKFYHLIQEDPAKAVNLGLHFQYLRGMIDAEGTPATDAAGNPATIADTMLPEGFDPEKPEAFSSPWLGQEEKPKKSKTKKKASRKKAAAVKEDQEEPAAQPQADPTFMEDRMAQIEARLNDVEASLSEELPALRQEVEALKALVEQVNKLKAFLGIE